MLQKKWIRLLLGLEKKNIFIFVQRIKQEHREKQNKQTFEIWKWNLET